MARPGRSPGFVVPPAAGWLSCLVFPLLVVSLASVVPVFGRRRRLGPARSRGSAGGLGGLSRRGRPACRRSSASAGRRWRRFLAAGFAAAFGWPGGSCGVAVGLACPPASGFWPCRRLAGRFSAGPLGGPGLLLPSAPCRLFPVLSAAAGSGGRPPSVAAWWRAPGGPARSAPALSVGSAGSLRPLRPVFRVASSGFFVARRPGGGSPFGGCCVCFLLCVCRFWWLSFGGRPAPGFGRFPCVGFGGFRRGRSGGVGGWWRVRGRVRGRARCACVFAPGRPCRPCGPCGSRVRVCARAGWFAVAPVRLRPRLRVSAGPVPVPVLAALRLWVVVGACACRGLGVPGLCRRLAGRGSAGRLGWCLGFRGSAGRRRFRVRFPVLPCAAAPPAVLAGRGRVGLLVGRGLRLARPFFFGVGPGPAAAGPYGE